MVAALAGAGGVLLAISELTARLDVNRCRVSTSLRRLVAAGRIERVGSTSRTRYRLVNQ